MSHKPPVSAIVIFLNEEKFLPEAVESVFVQRYDNWELLLVDDGSTDGSTAIARRYAEQYPAKVRYLEHLHHENRGMSASRNLGIRHARGEFIAFLDADDAWLPHKLEQQVSLLQAHPAAGMVYGPSRYWFSWTGDPKDNPRDYVRSLGVTPNRLVNPPRLLTLSLQSKAPTPCPSNIMLRCGIIEQVGGFEESFSGIYQLYEDQAFLAKVYLNGSVFVSGECWDRYRQHPESCVSVAKASRRKHSVGLFYLKWLESYLLARGINNHKLWKALRGKRFRYKHPILYRSFENVYRRQAQIKQKVRTVGRRAIPVPLMRWFRAQ